MSVTAPSLFVSLPAEMRRRGTALLNQQFWYWGQDIRRTEGNALLLHGFEKQRPPAEERGSSSYRLTLNRGQTVTLWGFGLHLGDPTAGGLYLSRFRLAPLLMPDHNLPSPIWAPTQLPPRQEPITAADWDRALRLFTTTLQWMGAYEAWARATLGRDYRARCTAAWSRPVCQAADVPALWRHLAYRAEATLRRLSTATQPQTGAARSR